VTSFHLRPAHTPDVPAMLALMAPLVEQRILLGKERVTLYESIQEFIVALDDEERLIGFGALHVFWEDLGEVRTLATVPEWRGRGVGHALLEALEDRARRLGLTRLFCLTFEVEFFARHGFHPVVDPAERIVDPETVAELLRSPDEGVAEFLELTRVKQNTLGNTRMLKRLD